MKFEMSKEWLLSKLAQGDEGCVEAGILHPEAPKPTPPILCRKGCGTHWETVGYWYRCEKCGGWQDEQTELEINELAAQSRKDARQDYLDHIRS